MSQFPSCPTCIEEMKKFPEDELVRIRNINIIPVPTKRHEDCLRLLEKYKQALEYIIQQGVTKKSMQSLWDRWKALEAARPDWAETSAEEASQWIDEVDNSDYEDSPDHKAKMDFLQEMSDFEGAVDKGLIWAGPGEWLRESMRYDDTEMLVMLDTTLDKLRNLYRSAGHTCRASTLPVITEIYRRPR